MPREIDKEAMNARIVFIKKMSAELNRMADALPAVARNSARILAGTERLEINLPDLVDPEPL